MCTVCTQCVVGLEEEGLFKGKAVRIKGRRKKRMV
jgi:hypothetical protein